MSELTMTGDDVLAKCEERARRLAQEKSYLQLVNNLMMQLSEVKGIETLVEKVLRLLLDNLGGSNVSLYYSVESVLHWADVFGKKMEIAGIEDGLVQRAFDSCEFVEVEHDFEQTRMLTPEFTTASTWAAPLMVGDELIGVLKLEDMLMAAREIRKHLEPFLRYAALALKNEISRQTKLQKAYDDLRAANARLSGEIRQRQEMEEALLREREFSRSLLESMADGVVACDAEGVLTLFNRAAIEWHGMDPKRLPPEEWAKHYDLFGVNGATPLSAEEVHLARAFRGEMVVDAGMAIRAKGRDTRFILANGSVIKNAGGQKLGAVVVMRDVTELRRVEEKLRNAKEQLERTVAERTAELKATLLRLQLELEERRRVEERLVITQFSVDSSADAILWVRPDGSFAYWNNATCEMLGYSNQEFLQLRAFDLNPEHQGEAWSEHWQELKRQKFLRFETFLARRDGSSVPTEITANHLEFNDQEYNAAFIRDISERKEFENQFIQEAAVNAAMSELTKNILMAQSIGEIASDILETARQVTGSQLGYVGYIDQTTGSLVCPTMTHEIWDQCGVPGKSIVFEKFAGLFGWVLTNKKSLMTNEPTTDSRSSGTPPGHIPITRFLSAPAFHGDTVVGQIALANSYRLFTEKDLLLVERMAAIFALGLRRRQAEEDLLNLNNELEQRVIQRTEEIEKKKSEVERMNKLFVGRELRMIELKERIKELESWR